MLSLVENITYPLLWGFIISSIIAFLFHLFAVLMNIQMSGKSLLLSIVMFIGLCVNSAKICSGFEAKYDLSECSEFIEENSKAKLSSINVSTSKSVIHELHPKLDNLIEIVDVQDPSNSAIYFNDLHSTLNYNMWKSLGWFLGFLFGCGTPALLLGQRRQNNKESRRGRSESYRARRNRR